MPKRQVDPLRLKNNDPRLIDAQQAAEYLMDKRGARGSAALLGWTQADMSRIANAKWKEIRMYPETVETLLMAQRMVENDGLLIEPLRDELHDYARTAGEQAKRTARIQKMIGKIARK